MCNLKDKNELENPGYVDLAINHCLYIMMKNYAIPAL